MAQVDLDKMLTKIKATQWGLLDVDWGAPGAERITPEQWPKLKEFMARAPEDPNGDIRLVKLLSLAGRKDEALAHGRRLRDRGFITPQIATILHEADAAGLTAKPSGASGGDLVVVMSPDRSALKRLGERLRHRLSPDAFRRAVLAMLAAMGISLILRAL